MGLLKNIWVSYVDRTYQQIKDRVLLVLQSKVPEMTDHTESNVFVKAIGIWSGIGEMLGYYIDFQGRESFVQVCRMYENMVHLANGYDYRIKSKLPATVDVVFYMATSYGLDIVIPQNTELATSDGAVFFTTSDATLLANTLEVSVSAIQQTPVINTLLGVSTGTKNQVFVIDSSKVVDRSVVVRTGVDTWLHVDTFAYSNRDDKHFRMTLNKDRDSIIEFGDNVNGLIPENGIEVFIDYTVTEAELGNVAEQLITEIATVLSLPVGVTVFVVNRVQAAGGTDVESIEDLRRRIPLSNRTVGVAVTERNFLDIAEQAPSVQKSGVWFDCGKTVKLYIVPTGGGIASQFLCQSVVAWFEDGRKLFSTNVEVYPAGKVEIAIKIDVTAYKGYQNSTVRQAIMNNLVASFSWEKQDIKGSLYISDIYQIVENTDGVKSSIIRSVYVIPYARSLDDFVVLNWTKTIKDTGATVNKWLIKMTSPTQFNVFKESTFEGNYSIGSLVDKTEISFIVNAGVYSTDDSWEFYTYPNPYPNIGVTVLEEFSVPVASLENLNVTVIGGF